MTKNNAILIIICICMVLLAMAVVMFHNNREHFTGDDHADKDTKTEDNNNAQPPMDAAYDSRMQTINIFHLVTNRKPSAQEISKYSVLGNEQDILVAILKDLQEQEQTKKVNSSQAAVVENMAQPEVPIAVDIIKELGRIQDSVQSIKQIVLSKETRV